MTAFRALLVVLWVVIAGYTAVVAANHGMEVAHGGAFFLTAYLLVVSVRAQGDVKELLLGRLRAAG